jgi:SAM-dependent methyltransferase
LERTRACFAWAGKGTAIVHAVLVSNRVATAVVGDAHVDLLRIDVTGPEEFHRVIDLLQISVRLDLRTQARNVRVPGSVEVVDKYREPVGLSLETFDVHILQVLVLSWNNDTKTEVITESLPHLLEKFDLVGTVLGVATAALVTGPLPIDVDATELPL